MMKLNKEEVKKDILEFKYCHNMSMILLLDWWEKHDNKTMDEILRFKRHIEQIIKKYM